MLARRQVLGTLAGAAASAPLTASRAAPRAGFPAGFTWGAATAAFSVEGAAAEDGRGPSVWDLFCKKPGAIFDGHTGQIASDHYHRFQEDVRLARQLGLRSYLFSISWSRVLPAGRGTVNERGMDFYKRLVDELLAAGVTPMIALFHWDLPQALSDRGGWLNRDAPAWFAAYAETVVQRLGDRATLWLTQNESQPHVGFGHLLGAHAPGLQLKWPEYVLCAHHTVKAHLLAMAAMRAAFPRLKIGYGMALDVRHPASSRPEDLDAARSLMFDVPPGRGLLGNSWWLDGVVSGRYPAAALESYRAELPPGLDLPATKAPIDFLGLGVYTSAACRQGSRGPEVLPIPSGYPRSSADWQAIVPQALYWGPRLVHERHPVPLYITGHGLATRDHLFVDGKVHDASRVDFLLRSVAELGRAVASGVPVRGYYHRVLLDGFEGTDGYRHRFGLVYVDYQSQQRVPKDSFSFYRKVISSNGAVALARTAVPVTQVTAP